MPKITLADLVAEIAKGTRSRDDLAQYFEVDPTRTRGMQLHFRINTEEVDVTGVEQSADAIGDSLASEAAGSQTRHLAPLTAVHQFICEGDSWFNHPLINGVIQVLQARGCAFANYASPGDTIENMIAQQQYMPDLRTGRVTHFLFSGGGNDVIGRLTEILNVVNPKTLDPKNPQDIASCIKLETFAQIKSALRADYNTLIQQVRSVSPSTRLVLHGYAHARPIPHGIYISPAFYDFLDWDWTDPQVVALAFAVVAFLVDRFNSMLKTLAKSNHTVDYIDFRPVVRQNVDADWFDHELHPSHDAALRMADKYQAILPPPAAVASNRKGRSKTA